MIPTLLEEARQAEACGDWDGALARYSRAYRMLPSSGGDAALAAEILRASGVVHWQRGDGELAEEHYDACLAIAEAAGLEGLRARALNGMAVLQQFRGHADDAKRLYAQSRELAAPGSSPRSSSEPMER